MLYQLGLLTIDVLPFNAHAIDRSSSADYAAKDVVGTMRPREFTGEGEETIALKGRLFPEKFGGLGGLSALDMMRKSGQPQLLIRGDGSLLGWFVIEGVTESSTMLDAQGVGKVIEVSIELARTPGPGPAGGYLSLIGRLIGGAPSMSASASISPAGVSLRVSVGG